MPIKTKGFIISVPMVGLMLFLISALIAGAIESENNYQIEEARGSESAAKLKFISSAIRADSYDVLLQENLESLTLSFLQDNYHLIRSAENADWQEALEDELSKYYEDNLGEGLGINLEAYRTAYSGMTSIKGCKIERATEVVSRPDVAESQYGDGTLEVRGESYGERIKCTSIDPPAEITVDILGRPYNVNVRLRDLYDVSKDFLKDMVEVVNFGTKNIEEPIGKWEGTKWFEIQKSDNKIIGEGTHFLEGLVKGFKGSWADEIDRIIKSGTYFAKNKISRRSKYDGIGISQLEIVSEDDDAFNIDDFEVSCVEDPSGLYRNCLPFDVRVILGDPLCHLGSPPENSKTSEFYNLLVNPRCDNGPCPIGFDKVLTDIISPLKSVCADYYATSKPVVPICKKWKGKARSVKIKGVVEDENQMYVLAGSDDKKVSFRFMDIEPDVHVNNIEASQLRCEGDNSDSDRYKDNVRVMLENTEIMLALRNVGEENLKSWIDIGSKIDELPEENLNSAYVDIYGKDGRPKPCFVSGATASPECDDKNKPKLEISIDWSNVRANCLEHADQLCNELCGGTADPEYKGAFCNSLFSEKGVSVGSGTLSCIGEGSCSDTEIKIDKVRLVIK